MSTVNYSRSSPYYGTTSMGNYLDVMSSRSIPHDPADVLYEIDSIYEHRPDLLANDIYGDVALWWIFAVRNPNVLQDPVFDFTPGTIIYVPKKETILTALGL